VQVNQVNGFYIGKTIAKILVNQNVPNDIAGFGKGVQRNQQQYSDSGRFL